MFWSKARKKYRNLTKDDEDIKKYLEITDRFQEEGYSGIPGQIQDLGHKFVSRFSKKGRTLEIGFGKGRQGFFFKGNHDSYYPTEVNRKYVTNSIWGKFKNALIADSAKLPFIDNFFDNAVSVYNLEHIQDIDRVFKEIKRVLKPEGKFLVVLPCEGGLVWNLGREFTTRKLFMNKYKINYDKIIAYEHVHNLKYVKLYLGKAFHKIEEKYYPFLLPSINLNFICCAVFVNKKN